MQEYTQEEYEGYLLWCIAYAIEGSEAMIGAYEPKKRIHLLDEKEFTVVNAQISLEGVYWQLEMMNIDVDKLKSLTDKNIKGKDIKTFVQKDVVVVDK